MSYEKDTEHYKTIFDENDQIIAQKLSEEIKVYEEVYKHNIELKELVTTGLHTLRTFVELAKSYIEAIEDNKKNKSLPLPDHKEIDALQEIISDLTAPFTRIKSEYHDHLRYNMHNITNDMKKILSAVKHLRKKAHQLGLKKEVHELKSLKKDEDLVSDDLSNLWNAGEKLFKSSEVISGFDNLNVEDEDDIEDAVELAEKFLKSIPENYNKIMKTTNAMGIHLREATAVGKKVADTDKKILELLKNYTTSSSGHELADKLSAEFERNLAA